MKVDLRTQTEKIRDAVYGQEDEFTFTDILIEVGNSKWTKAVSDFIASLVEGGLVEQTCGRPKRFRWVPDE